MTSESSTTGSQRTRRVAVSLITAVLTRPVSLAFQLVTTPLLLGYLGRERYGVFETISALAVWMSLANAGLTLGLINNLIDCYVSGDRETARRHVSSTVIPLFGIVVVLALLVAAIVPFIDWTQVFRGLSDRDGRELTPALMLSAVATLLAVLTSVPSAIYSAYQETHRNILWDAAGKIAAIGVTALVVHTKWGLLGGVFAMAVIPVLVRYLNGGHLLFVEKPWLRPTFASFDRALFTSSLRQSSAFFVLAITPIALYQADKLIVAVLIGPAGAADYALAGRLFVLTYGLFSMLYTPLWPSYGEAIRRGDMAWVRRTLRTTTLLSLACAFGVGGVMLVAGDRILTLWLRTPVHVPVGLILAFTVTFALRAWVDCRAIVLNSVSVLRQQIVFSVTHIVLALVAAVPLGKAFGTSGVAWGVPLGALFTTFWGYPWMIRRLMHARTKHPPPND